MRISEKIRNGGHQEPVIADLIRLNSITAKAAEAVTRRSAIEVRAFLHMMANSFARSVALDTREEQGRFLGRSPDQAAKDLKELHVELTCIYLFDESGKA